MLLININHLYILITLVAITSSGNKVENEEEPKYINTNICDNCNQTLEENQIGKEGVQPLIPTPAPKNKPDQNLTNDQRIAQLKKSWIRSFEEMINKNVRNVNWSQKKDQAKRQLPLFSRKNKQNMEEIEKRRSMNSERLKEGINKASKSSKRRMEAIRSRLPECPSKWFLRRRINTLKKAKNEINFKSSKEALEMDKKYIRKRIQMKPLQRSLLRVVVAIALVLLVAFSIRHGILNPYLHPTENNIAGAIQEGPPPTYSSDTGNSVERKEKQENVVFKENQSNKNQVVEKQVNKGVKGEEVSEKVVSDVKGEEVNKESSKGEKEEPKEDSKIEPNEGNEKMKKARPFGGKEVDLSKINSANSQKNEGENEVENSKKLISSENNQVKEANQSSNENTKKIQSETEAENNEKQICSESIQISSENTETQASSKNNQLKDTHQSSRENIENLEYNFTNQSKNSET